MRPDDRDTLVALFLALSPWLAVLVLIRLIAMAMR